ncbi:hypothetical protein C4544_03515 [candidate division WS5 bacterium]|uniref:DUF5673 domain-containing protein n=1 Tax=candidate division WS5 bacterium TaxID=2093353 RepID=A0A419DDA4_9BACT|nr:MAG: hypothetical protein C4544_03515 [candidate division WS5 bacterium]
MSKFIVKKPTEKQRTFQSSEDAGESIKTFLSWRAPARPFRKKDRSYYTTIAIIVTLLALIALLAQEVLLIGVLLALTFVVYVLAFVAPEEVEYKISTQGITIGNHFYFWDDLNSFWFEEKEGEKLLHIPTYLRFPGKLMLVLGTQNEEQIKKIVVKYLPFHEVAPKTLMDSWAESLQKHFPLENPHR